MLGFATLVVLLVILLAMAPSLLFNRTIDRKLSGWASGFLGRPVIIENIRFGWRTPLSVSRIAIPAVAGEENYPLLDIRGVSIPLSLGRIAMLPPYSLSINVEKIEFNLVRTKDGGTNLASLLAAFGGGKPAQRQPSAPGPAGDKKTTAPTLPLKSIRISLKQIDARYVDMPGGMTAGMEGGSVFLNWTGDAQPLEGRLAGAVRLNQTILPWELGISLSSWITSGRRLSLDTAGLTVDSGGGTNAPVFLDLSMAAGRKSTAHAALPLALLSRVNSALNLSPAAPELDGTLDLRLALTHGSGFKDWNISSTLLIKDVTVKGGASASETAQQATATGLPGATTASTNSPVPARAFDGSLGISGSVTLNTSVTLPGPSVDSRSPVKVSGELVTTVNSLDLTAGKMSISLADFIDRRKFDVSVDPASPADLIYSDDAHTCFSYFEGTMGVVLGKCALDARAGLAPPGIVTYDISSAEVNDLAFASPALQVTVPPIRFSGGFAVRLKDSVFEGKDLRLSLGNFLSASCAPSFNWTNGAFRITAGVNLSSLSNAAAMVQFKSTNAPALPRLAGGLSASVNLAGAVPRTAFVLGQPLPVAGEVNIRLTDIGVDINPRLAVHGINTTADISLSADGRDVSGALDFRVADLSVGGGLLPPITNVNVSAFATVHEFNRIEAELRNLGIGSLRTTASARMTVDGLLAALSTNATGTGAVKWLHALSLDGAVSLNQDLEGISGIVTNLDCKGNMGFSASFVNSPSRSLSVAAGLSFRKVGFRFADTVKVDGVNGGWSLTKTFLAPDGGRKPVSPPPGGILIDSIDLKLPQLPLKMHKMAITFRGLEQGLKISLAVPDMIGGPTEAACTLSMRGGNPEIAAKATVTGLNGGALFPGLKFKHPGDGDVNAVADVSIVLPPDPRGILLDYLNLRIRTMRIGKDALVRILKAMDSRQETPQFQNAISALSLGTAIGAEVLLANSLVSVSADLLVAGGVKLTLPMLDSEPLSDIMGVYKLEGAEQQLDGLRKMLLILMTNDLAELEKSLAGAAQ